MQPSKIRLKHWKLISFCRIQIQALQIVSSPQLQIPLAAKQDLTPPNESPKTKNKPRPHHSYTWECSDKKNILLSGTPLWLWRPFLWPPPSRESYLRPPLSPSSFYYRLASKKTRYGMGNESSIGALARGEILRTPAHPLFGLAGLSAGGDIEREVCMFGLCHQDGLAMFRSNRQEWTSAFWIVVVFKW